MAYAIGTKFWYYRGKHDREYIITEVYSTYNSKGELVRNTYDAVSTQPLLGQFVTWNDICETAITRSIL